MKKYSCRIALRLGTLEKERIEQLIVLGKFKTLSQAIRTALGELVKKEETNQKTVGSRPEAEA